MTAALLFAVSGGGAAAPGGVSAAESASSTPVSITLGHVTVGALQWPSYVAEKEGFFTQQGLNVTGVLVDTNLKAAEGLISGSLQFADGSPDPEIKANAKANAGLLILGSAMNNPVYRLIVTPGIHNFNDLRGKKVGVSATLSMDGIWMRDVLAKHGLQPGSYELVEAGGTSTRFQALKAGALAAAWLTQPQDFQALSEGMHSLTLSSEAMKEIIWSAYNTKRQWAAAHKDIVIRFLKAVVLAHRWLYDPKNRDAAIQILMDNTNAGKEQVTQTYDLWIKQKALSDHGETTALAINNMMQALVASHQLDAPLPLDRVWDPSYLKEAIKELGLSVPSK
jgi:ABC-type nitrate/sulfonate/bicarbonate transport system substrate-binding protein